MLEFRNLTKHKIDRAVFTKALRAVLQEVKKSDQARVSLALVGSAHMRRLNYHSRGRDEATDVLSFSGQVKGFVDTPGSADFLGEIVICYPCARQQARHSGYTLNRELTLLFIHGILHLAGYDHRRDKERTAMRRMEAKILAQLGF